MAVALAKAKELGYEVVACASTGNLANAVAAHAAAAGLESYVFIPADLEEQKVLATGCLRHPSGGRARQLRRREPALHRAFLGARLGVRQREPAAVLRRGLEDAGVRDRRAARLRAAGPRGRSGGLRLAVHEDRARIRGVARARASSRAPCRTSTAPRRPAARPWPRRSRTARTSAGPVKPDTIAKSLAIGNPADGPYALELARRSGGSVESVGDQEIRDGIRLLAETTGIFTETAGGVTTAVLRKLARAGRDRTGRAGGRRDHR